MAPTKLEAQQFLPESNQIQTWIRYNNIKEEDYYRFAGRYFYCPRFKNRGLEATVNVYDYERGLLDLLQGLEYVPGTFPPVYMLGTVLISFDKTGRAKMVETSENRRPQTNWTDRFPARVVNPVGRFIRR